MTWIEQAKSFGYSYKKERHRHRFTLGDAVISFGPVRKELRVQFNGLESRITNVEVEELPVVFRRDPAETPRL